MTDIDEYGRPEPPLDADEAETLVGFLEYQRATLAWKCSGLDAAGLRATVGPSSMTLGGLLKHLALVEDHWFSWWLLGRERYALWTAVDWDGDPDWEWRTAGGLGGLAERSWPDGRAPNLRWILCHMIEEYARHNGHADLLRESVDGLTGE
jgi:hypothetical protein